MSGCLSVWSWSWPRTAVSAAPKLSQGLLVFNVILMFVAIPLVNWIVFWIVIGKICDGANAAY